MPRVTKYKLDNGKGIWTNDLKAFEGTIFEGRVVLPEAKKKV